MSDLNRPGDDRDPALEDPETTEERLREQVGLDPDGGSAGGQLDPERPGEIDRVPPPPD